MRFENMSEKKKKVIVILLFLPLIVAIFLIFFLRYNWREVLPGGESFSPIENRPLFIGLVIFAVGYMFFLGMLFFDNILNLLNSRRSINKR